MEFYYFRKIWYFKQREARLSPILFGIYMDNSIKSFKDSNIGCKIGNNYVGVSCYAEDLTLISPTLTGLKCMRAICENYSDEYKILFNASKSQLLHFTNSNTEEKITLEINNNKIIESILNVYVLESTTRLYIDIMICHLQFVILTGKSTNYLLFFIC